MLKPSPAYAHITAATDEAAMKPVFETELSKIWGRPAEILNFFIPRVFSKGGGRFLIQYRFLTAGTGGGKNWIFFGELLAPDEMIPRFVQPGQAFFVPELRLAVPVFPFDPKLKELPRFFRMEQADSVLSEIRPFFNLNGTAALEQVEVLGYRLERRGLLRLTILEKKDKIALVAKLVRPDKAHRIFGLMQELEKAGFNREAKDKITVPHVFAKTGAGVIWQEALADPSLHDLIGSEAFIPGCRRAARALAKLHSARLGDLVPHTAEEELKRLQEIVAETGRIYPVLKVNMDKIFCLLKEEPHTIKKEEATPIHRDFYDKQVLNGTERTTLVDVDTLSSGDPALDVGNFFAHLVLRAGQHPEAREALRQAGQAFAEEYRATAKSAEAEAFWKRAGWWETSALLRLACLYSLRPRWKELTPSILAEAQIRIQTSGEKNA